MYSCKLKLFTALLALLFTAMCTPAKNKDAVKTEMKSDTLPKSIKGKIIFSIKNRDFFTNATGKKINSVEEFRRYVPVFFYEKDGEFYIPNRIDNIIYKIDRLGRVIEKIQIPIEISLAHFYITNSGEKYILNHKGLTVYNKENQKVREDLKVIFITPDFSNDNLLITRRQGDQDESTPLSNAVLERTDIKKIMSEPFSENVHYVDCYFDSHFLFEISYDSLTGDGPKDGYLLLKKYDLHTLKPVSKNLVAMKCGNCFHMPFLLSEKLVVASDFSDKENPANELFLFGEKEYKKLGLIPPIKEDPLNDIEYIGRMPLNFCFSFDKERKKLYSLATTEKEVVVIEYDIPENFR